MPLVSSFIKSVKSNILTGSGTYFPETSLLPATTLPPHFLQLPVLNGSLKDPFVQLVVLPPDEFHEHDKAITKTPSLCIVRRKDGTVKKRVCAILSTEDIFGSSTESESPTLDLPNVAFLSPALAHSLDYPTQICVAVSKVPYDEAVKAISVAKSVTLSPVSRKGILETFPFPPHGSQILSDAIAQRFQANGIGRLVRQGDIVALHLKRNVAMEEYSGEEEFWSTLQSLVFMCIDKVVGMDGEERNERDVRIEMGTTAIARGDETVSNLTEDIQEAIQICWGREGLPGRQKLSNILGLTTNDGWIGNIIVEGGSAAISEVRKAFCPGSVLLPVKAWEDEREIEKTVAKALRLRSRMSEFETHQRERVSVLLIVEGWEFWQGKWKAKRGRAQRSGKGLERLLWRHENVENVAILAMCHDLDSIDGELRARFTHELRWDERSLQDSELVEPKPVNTKADVPNGILPKGDSCTSTVNGDESSEAMSCNASDQTYQEQRPREEKVDTNGVTWDDVGGLSQVKQTIIEMVEYPQQFSEFFASGAHRRGGILLYGPPGTGKTLLARAVADSCGLSFIGVKGPELLDSYVGESEKNVRRVFERARHQAPCVIFFDELDALAPSRGMGRDSAGVTDRVVSMLAGEMEETLARGNIYVIGATNRPDLVDSGLMRAGRFDKRVFVPLPETRKAQVEVLLALTRKFNFEEKVDDAAWEKVASNLPDPPSMSGADLYSMVADAWMVAAKRTARSVSLAPKKKTSEEQVLSLLDQALLEEKEIRGDFVERSPHVGKREVEVGEDRRGTCVLVSEEDLLQSARRAKSSLRRAEVESYYRLRDQLDGSA